ncbi:hypothetical protein D1007_01643 [Hordeum vulgare]|nr:hypothetical protein D1007_01643 [Hordeum vulgare]
MTHIEIISSSTAIDFDMHLVETHMRKMDLTMVYIKYPVMVSDCINTMERFIVEDDKYKVVSFDLAYTGGRAGHDHKVVVAQLCVHHHVLLYHYRLATVPCEHFTRLDNSPNYRFAIVDTTNDQKVIKTSGLENQKLVNILGHYKIWGNKKDMSSHVDLAEAIIDLYYGGMKAESEKNKPVCHMAWVKRLDEHHPQTAAKEAYTRYKMFTRIIDMRNYLLPEYVEGSSDKQSGGGKLHRK